MERGEWAGPLAEFVHQRAVLLSANPGFNTLMSLNVVRNAVPFEYQIKAVKDVLQRMRGRALLCDEVGLGKTIEAGLVVTEYLLRGLARKALVLCPSPLVEQWAEEFRSKFNLDFVLFDDPKFQGHPHPWQAFDRIIASIDTVKREPHRSRVMEMFFDIVVVDEAHRCRNRSTLNWTLVNQLQKKYILLLTATPVQNDLEELYNLITLLRPGQLETAASFTRNFITRGNRMQPKNVERLRMLTREVMIRNKRSSVGISLPKRSADTIQVALSPTETALYKGVTDYVRTQYAASAALGNTQMTLKTLQREVGSSPHAVIPTLRKLADSTKDPDNQKQLWDLLGLGSEIRNFSKGDALIRLLQALRNDKVIVFTGFTHTLDALAKLCHEAGIAAVVFHGQMRRLEKEAAIQQFARDVPVLLSTESGGEGRNLQFCHTMINFDLPWNPMRIEQRIGRIHRIGQQHHVHIYNLAAANTIEEQILNLLDSKINLFELVVGELDMILGDITEGRDFEDLLMEIWAGSASQAELDQKLADLGDALARSKDQYLKVRQAEEEIFG
ncbi:helicase SNF2 [Clostridiales bacterium PH28_bin88]|nr:helicase SNF2 [Clostridiales bacterium PH28_bin88]